MKHNLSSMRSLQSGTSERASEQLGEDSRVRSVSHLHLSNRIALVLSVGVTETTMNKHETNPAFAYKTCW